MSPLVLDVFLSVVSSLGQSWPRPRCQNVPALSRASQRPPLLQHVCLSGQPEPYHVNVSKVPDPVPQGLLARREWQVPLVPPGRRQTRRPCRVPDQPDPPQRHPRPPTE